MDQHDSRAAGGRSWRSARPLTSPEGPPGLAALLDAERSVLRTHHECLSAHQTAQELLASNEHAVELATQQRTDAQRQTPGLRGRLHVGAHDSRLLLADARQAALTARSALQACEIRIQASERRLDEVRALIDRIVHDPDDPRLGGLRRTSAMPSRAQLYPTVEAFLADQPDRAVGDPRLQDLVGDTLGERWTLEEPGQPWIVTRWRAMWGPEEIYAVELVSRPRSPRRVWLLGRAIRDRDTLAIVQERGGRQAERNSLAGLAAALAPRA